MEQCQRVAQGHFLFYNERQCIVKGKERKGGGSKWREELAADREKVKRFSEGVLQHRMKSKDRGAKNVTRDWVNC